jgi:hypothetical protein
VKTELFAKVTYHPIISFEVVEMARRAVTDFHSCLWWWKPECVPQTKTDLHVIDPKKGPPRLDSGAKVTFPILGFGIDH